MVWSPYQGGASVGSVGSENGTVTRDEEHSEGARITLERDGRTAPWSITCGVYGLLAHTRFFATEALAEEEFDQMKVALDGLLDRLDSDDLEGQGQLAQEFVARFP